jgi:hypothetical protein
MNKMGQMYGDRERIGSTGETYRDDYRRIAEDEWKGPNPE